MAQAEPCAERGARMAAGPVRGSALVAAAAMATPVCALSPHVAAAVAAAVAAGAHRRVVAAVAASAVRAAADGNTAGEQQEEVEASLRVMQPVLVELVSAGAAGREPAISGVARLRRNVAAHAGFGEGPQVVEESVAELRRRQRGRRAGKAAKGCTERVSEPEIEAIPGKAVTVGSFGSVTLESEGMPEEDLHSVQEDEFVAARVWGPIPLFPSLGEKAKGCASEEQPAMRADEDGGKFLAAAADEGTKKVAEQKAKKEEEIETKPANEAAFVAAGGIGQPAVRGVEGNGEGAISMPCDGFEEGGIATEEAKKKAGEEEEMKMKGAVLKALAGAESLKDFQAALDVVKAMPSGATSSFLCRALAAALTEWEKRVDDVRGEGESDDESEPAKKG